MLSIQSIMLVALGFLSAALLALTIAPAFWSRAVRLTTQRIKERLPVTETEIRADKDRLRAEFAMTVHRLESKIESAEMKRARHMIDLNRRDANITKLEGEVTTLRGTLEEYENARRVLEHTVSDQLPRVETRLGEARNLLATRDTEINKLSDSTHRQQQALDETRNINAQLSAEIERLTTALTVRGGRNQLALNDHNTAAEVALRAEIEALRSKNRDQQTLIARLQLAPAALEGARAGAGGDGLPALVPLQAPDELQAALERDLRGLRSKSDDQAAEIKMLSAELAAMRSADAANMPDSKLALRSKLTGTQMQVETQTEMVRKLRAELAAANERLALQGAHFMEQMRRMGAGTLQTTGTSAGVSANSQPAATPVNGVNGGAAGGTNGARRNDAAALRLSLAERVAQSRGPQTPVGGRGAAQGADIDDAIIEHDDAKTAAGGANGTSGRLVDRISSLSKV